MPELPEVETVKNVLIKCLKDRTIVDCKIFDYKIINFDKTFINKVKNQKVLDIRRIGKYLIFELSDWIIVGHLRMEGKFYYKSINEPINKHEHFEFILDNNMSLRYHDFRKFGHFDLFTKDEYMFKSGLRKLGKEPFEITKEELFDKIKNKRLPIKQMLLDQSIMAGIGNIYANEICFLVGYSPLLSCSLLDLNDCKRIIENSIIILNKAISMGGTTVSSFESEEGIHGMFQNELYVHQRENRPCKKCGTLIKKIFVGQRGTYYCPCCQRPILVGITGGIATGKSTVAEYLIKKKYLVIDSDLIVSNLLNTQNVVKTIDKAFNNVVKDNEIDKKALATIVFDNKQLLEKLNQIIHPLVFTQIDEIISQNQDKNLIFIDMPLLIETGYYKNVDEIVLVYANEEIQRTRLIFRDRMTDEQITKRLNAQLNIEEKRKYTNHIINNETTIKKLYEQIDKMIERIINNEKENN